MKQSTVTPVAKFGKDHWSALAYAEACCVGGKAGVGTLAKPSMRCNPDKRPLMGSGRRWEARYGTRLLGFFDFSDRSDPVLADAAGLQLLDHDDWDCLEDLEAAGFVDVLSLTHGLVRMTDLGCEVAAAVRKHKAQGNTFATFTWQAVATPSGKDEAASPTKGAHA